MDSDDGRKCKKCGIIKALDEFRNSPRSVKKRGAVCLSCEVIASKKWQQENVDAVRRSSRESHHRRKGTEKFQSSRLATRLRLRYGMTLGDYEAMLEDQEGLCGICGKPENAKYKNGVTRILSVDHDHATGRVRGLLCMKCNVALGAIKDDISIAKRVVKYLRTHKRR